MVVANGDGARASVDCRDVRSPPITAVPSIDGDAIPHISESEAGVDDFVPSVLPVRHPADNRIADAVQILRRCLLLLLALLVLREVGLEQKMSNAKHTGYLYSETEGVTW